MNIFDKKKKPELKPCMFHLRRDQVKPLAGLAKDLGVPKSEVIRRALDLFQTEYKKHNK
jgi:hypothetical protein